MPCLGPLAHPAADRAGRAARAGDALVAGAEDQCGDDVLEDDAVRDAPAVTAEGVVGINGGMIGQQGGKLRPQGAISDTGSAGTEPPTITVASRTP